MGCSGQNPNCTPQLQHEQALTAVGCRSPACEAGPPPDSPHAAPEQGQGSGLSPSPHQHPTHTYPAPRDTMTVISSPASVVGQSPNNRLDSTT
jgi:hypothetical protein